MSVLIAEERTAVGAGHKVLKITGAPFCTVVKGSVLF